ncbi:MAG: matrixin family metalloprotease [Deltaproteobacteria bacterium]|nr:matrixin family metalloprotease [Deltaproteobacteria bacterium]
MGRSEALLGAVLAVALIGAPREARAWCRTTTTQGFVPTASEPCDATGRPLYWSTRCVGFSVQRDGSRWIDLATTRAVAQRSFDAWKRPACPADPVACSGPFDKGTPSIEVKDIGPVSCDCVEYNGKVGNANAIVFRDVAWTECDGTPKPDADTTLALTTVTFNTESGEIYDADMEVNTANNPITTADPPGRVLYDFESILTHEAGHFLGLAHTNLPQPTDKTKTPTMYARYEQREVYMRDLSQDDICAICAAYPPGRSAPCDTTPRRGLALECGGGDPESTVTSGCAACAVPGGRASGADAALGLGGATLLLGVIARRRRGR